MKKQLSPTRSILGLLAAVCGLQTPQASATLDQFHETNPVGPSGWAISNRNAQTFTAGLSGRLDAVGVEIFQSNEGASGDVWVEIWGTDAGGAPDFDISDSNALAKVLIPNAVIPSASDVQSATTFTVADFTAENFFVSAGSTYTIRLVRTDLSEPGIPPWILWRGANNRPDVYAGGDSYLYNGGWDLRVDDSDHGFQTFVTVPEPASGALLLGLFAVAGRRRR